MKKQMELKGFIELNEKEKINTRGGTDKASTSSGSSKDPGIDHGITIGIPFWKFI